MKESLTSKVMADVLSLPLPLGNDLKILVLSFVASERRDGGNNEIGEERGDSWHSLSRLPKPADWIGRDGSVVHVCPPTVRDRAPIQTADIKSFSGWLSHSESHSVQGKEAGPICAATIEVSQSNPTRMLLVKCQLCRRQEASLDCKNK